MALNKTILLGNLCADPELKQTQSGVSVTQFNLAVQRRAPKEGQPQADFITVVAWRQTAELICKHFKKGSPILVCGSLQTRSYTANDGSKRYVTEVVTDEISFAGFVGGKKDEPKKEEAKATTEAIASAPGDFTEIGDDDLPF